LTELPWRPFGTKIANMMTRIGWIAHWLWRVGAKD